MNVFPITSYHAAKILVCFQQLGVIGDVRDYKTIYRDSNSNFLCNVHTGKKGMSMELQNAESNDALAQILRTIVQEPEPLQTAW